MHEFLRSAISCAALLALVLLFPLPAAAEDLTFSPGIISTEGDLGVSMSRQTTDYTHDGTINRSSTGTFFSERVTTSANGYVYHPRFMLFMGRMSAALNEWDLHGSGGSSSSMGTGVFDYELRTIFLPEHPYNLELYTLHQEASSPTSFWSGQRGSLDNRGAIFTLREAPYSFHLSYNDSIADSSSNRVETQSYRASGNYQGRSLSHSAAYFHTDTLTAFNIKTTQDDSSYFNSARFASIVLNSRVGDRTTEEQKPADGSFNTDTFNWTEQLAAPLPLNFHTDVSFGYQDATTRTDYGTTGQAPTEEFNRSTNTMFHLSHQLYQSLATNYTVGRSSTESSTGEISSRSQTLSTAYTKSIPTGRIMIGGQYGTSAAERSGTTAIINEVHNAPLLGSFALAQQNVNAGSIIVYVKDPPTGSLMQLPANNYVVTAVGTSVQITIESVSPATLQPDPAFVYEFQVSYSLADQSQIDSRSEGYSFRIDLLENLLSAYYNGFVTKQQVVSGTVTGGADVTASEIAGLSAQQGSYSGNLEHQTFRSRLSPSESWKTSAQYRTQSPGDLNFSARLFGVWTEHFPSAALGSVEYNEHTQGTDLRMDMKFPRNNLTLFVSGSYFETWSLVDSNMLSLNTSVTWRLGLLSVNGGVLLSRSESMYASGTTTLTTQNIYVMLNRKLF